MAAWGMLRVSGLQFLEYIGFVKIPCGENRTSEVPF